MRKSIYIVYAMLLAMPIVALITSCEPKALTENDLFIAESDLDAALSAENPEGYKIFQLEEFLDTFMTGATLPATPVRTVSVRTTRSMVFIYIP